MKSFLGLMVKIFNILLLAILAAVMFLMTIGRPLVNIIYVLVIAVVVIMNLSTVKNTWWQYLLALAAGLAAINLVSAALGSVVTALWNDQLARTFGHPADENEGGAVPVSCAKPFDPVEKALNELEQEFERNAITEDEYLKRKEKILNSGGNE